MKTDNFDETYNSVLDKCRNLFESKLKDYGPTWLYFRDVSLVDTLWIKIKRIITLENNGGLSLVNEGRDSEFIGIINYSIVLLMKTRYPDTLKSADYYISNAGDAEKLTCDKIMKLYSGICDEIFALWKKKNHDYNAAWVEMHPFSITDQILIRVLRIKNFLENGNPHVSEGTDAQLMDIVIYSLFGYIKATQEICQ